MRRFALYAGRWQLSTPILWLVVSQLGTSLEATILANLIGASIFFWVDRFIFRQRREVVWEVMQSGLCADCASSASVKRLVLAPGGRRQPGGLYDRRHDAQPEYRCTPCSDEKLTRLASAELVANVS